MKPYAPIIANIFSPVNWDRNFPLALLRHKAPRLAACRQNVCEKIFDFFEIKRGKLKKTTYKNFVRFCAAEIFRPFSGIFEKTCFYALDKGEEVCPWRFHKTFSTS